MRKYFMLISSIVVIAMMITCLGACGQNKKTEEIEQLSEHDFVVSGSNIEMDNMDMLQIINDNANAFQFFYYDSIYDDSREGVVITSREITLGTSKQKVLETYGNECEDTEFDADNDRLFEAIGLNSVDSDTNNELQNKMKNECRSLLRYSYEGRYSIVFYFDKEDKLSWLFFVNDEVNY